MVIRLPKKIADLRIGILGDRSAFLEEVFSEMDIPVVRLGSANSVNDTFDIVFASGVYTLLSGELISRPKFGVIMFHESPLPEGRGFAPIYWTVHNSRPHLTVTAFQARDGMDSGPIVYQLNVPLSDMDSFEVINEKRVVGIKECLRCILEEMGQGYIVLREQTGTVTVVEKRTADDSELDSSRPLAELWDSIRVCDNERFPAFFRIRGKKIVLRYTVEDF